MNTDNVNLIVYTQEEMDEDKWEAFEYGLLFGFVTMSLFLLVLNYCQINF